ncbi:hypothetical protein M3M39_00825 [Fructilactobacillus hinvesii]|uniref:LPXTG cell wall anchor domain-containing protein n=1 Tax=Fructilactobacillus hinvesii TaxID=2940300 RepID=A0ABY5BSL4_9LACO|nr:hypothetical protein [Fructilactobacillus hinvesii]USS88062.1 hypothetical protein M3M39_00825 [Fructilactobacillus hinvesii]
MKFDKQKAFLFAVLGLALIAIVFGTSSIYADNQASNDSAKSTAAVSVSKKNDHEKPKPKQKTDSKKPKQQPQDTSAPMASVKPAPVAELPQTGQFLHIGVTTTGILVLFLVSLIVLNRQFQTKLKKLSNRHAE